MLTTCTVRAWCKKVRLMMLYNQTKCGCKRISRSADEVEQSHFDHMSLHCDLDIKVCRPIILRTLQLMMMHHHTKFGNKRFGGSEVINQKNKTFIKILNLACEFDHETEQPNLFTRPVWPMTRTRSSEDIRETVIITLSVTAITQATQSFNKTVWPMMTTLH